MCKVNIQCQGNAEAPDQRDRASGTIFELTPSLLDQPSRNSAINVREGDNC